jgi:hypothetical protein
VLESTFQLASVTRNGVTSSYPEAWKQLQANSKGSRAPRGLTTVLLVASCAPDTTCHCQCFRLCAAVCDPVLGDEGQMYVSEELKEAYRTE